MKNARAVPVLTYHHVSPAAGPLTVTPENFAKQMAMLSREGYTTLGSQAFGAYLAGERVPAKSVVVTFDDGYLDNWVYAHPILARHGFTALGFLVTSWVNDGPLRPNTATAAYYLPKLLGHGAAKAALEAGLTDEVIVRWSEVRAMREAGTFEFHSHTHTQTRWDGVSTNAAVKRAHLRRDLLKSRMLLEKNLGEISDHLCWPQGYFDAGYLETGIAVGFRHFYTTVPGTNVQHRNLKKIRRLDVRNRPANWLKSRLRLHVHPFLSRLYLTIK